MTYTQIKGIIQSIGVPFAYYQFDEKTAQAPPFICFYYPQSNDVMADDTNYVDVRQLVIELYTDEKDFTLEAQVETTLKNNNLVYVAESTYLDDEKMWETAYVTEVVING